MTESEELSALKELLFKERVRIMEEREAFEEEKRAFAREKEQAEMHMEQKMTSCQFQQKRLNMEKELFDRKLDILQREYRRLAADKQQLEQQKHQFEEGRRYRNRPGTQRVVVETTDILFQGVDNELALKKRYRELLKIFHPDNLNGDTQAIQNINQEYDSLKRMYC